MSTLAGDFTKHKKESPLTIEPVGDVEEQTGADSVSRAGLVVAGVIVVSLALAAGWIVYQRRRRRSLIERLQSAIPEAVWELPEEVRARVKAL